MSRLCYLFACAVIPTTSPVTQNEIVSEGTEQTPAALIIAKRQAPEIPADGNCMIYRLGSFSSTLDIVRKYKRLHVQGTNKIKKFCQYAKISYAMLSKCYLC